MKRRRRYRWRGYLLLTLIFIIISAPRTIKLLKCFQKLQFYRSEIERLERENKILEEKINRLKTDPYYIEKIARENYGLLKDGEYIFKIKDVSN
ncbi:MAG TPA: septum formation initiator family protein [Firmicutes bacterium]|nr:septum formation initiator family protein [Bacillota bacterium]